MNFNELKKTLKKDYSGVWSFLKSSQNFVWCGILVFFLFVFLGAFLKIPDEISVQLLDYFKDLVKMTEGYGSIKMVLFIFFNNLKASFFGMVLGIFFGVIPLFYLLANGFVLGFASRFAVAQEGIFSLWRLLPHGIFELPAVFISLGLGLKIGSSLFEKKDKKKKLKGYFLESLKVFALIVLLLLLIAAIIEGLLINLIS